MLKERNNKKLPTDDKFKSLEVSVKVKIKVTINWVNNKYK